MTPGDCLQRSYQGVWSLPRAHQLCLHWQCAICICPRCSLLGQARGAQVWPAYPNPCSHRYISKISSTGWSNENDIISSTVNRLCGSGFQSIVNGVQEILAGDAQVEDFHEHLCCLGVTLSFFWLWNYQVVLTGGTDNMSACPYAVRDIRSQFEGAQKCDWLAPLKVWHTSGCRSQAGGHDVDLPHRHALWHPHGCHCGKSRCQIWCHQVKACYSSAQSLWKPSELIHNLTFREDCDAFALRSQQTWGAAAEAGVFADEITPITLKIKKKEVEMKLDEHPKPKTTLEQLAKLPPVFKKGGVVTAGGASGAHLLDDEKLIFSSSIYLEVALVYLPLKLIIPIVENLVRKNLT